MKTINLIQGSLMALALSASSALFADSLLNGLAAHKELGKEMFLGALYTDQLSGSASELLHDSGDKRLELRITAKRLSSRRLNSLWIEGMAINIPGSQLAAQAENMVGFTNMLRGKRLKQGDIISISSAAGEGTLVELNGVRVGQLESDTFSSLLLSTWIGSVPLSSEFREGLLLAGDIPDERLARFEAIAPSAERRQQVAQWSAPKAQLAKASRVSKPAATKTPDITAPSIAAPTLAAPSITTPVAAAPALPEPAQALAQTTEIAPPATGSSTPLVNTNADQLEDELLDDEFGDDDLEDSAPLLTAESLLSRQRFHSSLLKWTYKHIRYPNRAIDRGQEGSVRIAVIIDRNGEVIESTELESSRFSTLNKAAMRAVKKASPFPAMPDEIAGEQFAFSLPIMFKLPD